jgi:hypothetical protein
VPGIFFTGEKDLEYRTDIIKGIFAVNRRFGALWAIAEEPGAGHEIGLTQKLAISFFQEILALRIPQASAESLKGQECVNFVRIQDLLEIPKPTKSPLLTNGRKPAIPRRGFHLPCFRKIGWLLLRANYSR